MQNCCEIYLCEGGKSAMEKYEKKDPHRAVRIRTVIKRVREYGWDSSTKADLIKILSAEKQVGEIREMGKGGTRLIFFWEDIPNGRELYVTDIPKKGTLTKLRLRRYIAAAAVRRQAWLKTGEC